MLTSHPKKRYRCRYCGVTLHAYLPCWRGVSSRRTDFYATGLVIKKGIGDRKRFGV
jgi:hypothetical protein